uniref:Bifunctional inhibitor/plant lipid transfer protein/seed storage helical domain-containing protein n=2 Tax=Aegilops tauschii TaxID=37682 RepID=A0A452XTF0_AEGTS
MAKLMCLCFIILTIAVAMSVDECEGDRQAMIKECAKYQQWPANPKLDPSEACCAVWQKANIPCLCAGVTKEKEKIYCMEKVAYVANFCKKPDLIS